MWLENVKCWHSEDAHDDPSEHMKPPGNGKGKRKAAVPLRSQHRLWCHLWGPSLEPSLTGKTEILENKNIRLPSLQIYLVGEFVICCYIGHLNLNLKTLAQITPISSQASCTAVSTNQSVSHLKSISKWRILALPLVTIIVMFEICPRTDMSTHPSSLEVAPPVFQHSGNSKFSKS